MGPERKRLAEILYRALSQPIGLLLMARPPDLAVARLASVRKEIADPALDVLQFRRSPFEDGDLIIIKKEQV